MLLALLILEPQLIVIVVLVVVGTRLKSVNPKSGALSVSNTDSISSKLCSLARLYNHLNVVSVKRTNQLERLKLSGYTLLAKFKSSNW